MAENSSSALSGEKLSIREMVSYGLPRFGSAAMFLAVGIYLPKFYTDTLLLAPAFIAWTFLIGRFWDGFTDPIMGHISDRTRSKMGRRRPYFLVSAIPLGIAFYFLWSPPAALKDWELFFYLTATYLLTYTFMTVFSIPHNSLGAEMTMDYHERTVLTGVREGLGVSGTLVGTLAPPIFAVIIGSRQGGYSVMAGSIGILTAVLILFCFFNVRENPEFQKQHPLALKKGLVALYENRPFRVLVSVFVFALMGNAFVPILTLYIADYVVKIEPERVRVISSAVIVSYLLMATVSIVFWTRLSHRIGKKEAWSYALILSSVVFVASTYYHEGTWVIWIILASIAGFGFGCTYALAYSMMADVIDLDELQTGRRREGAYFGIWFFVEKGAVGLTAFIGMQTLSLMGYVPNQEQTPQVWWALKFLYSILPAICFAACYFILRRYPITQEEHARIRSEIEAKKAAS
ncbi:MAG: MFS transporter [Candidatus Abyssubacteria bacterium]|nr:MFS transporter [Candidatus Abyssubacteria bacterium]